MKLPLKIVGAAAGGALALAAGFAKVHEGRVYHTYFDIANVATICDGHTGPDVKPGAVANDAVCDALLDGDLAVAFAAVDKYVIRPEELKPWVRAAAADLIFRAGVEAFRKSTFLRLLNERRIPEACDTLLWWNKARAGPNGTLVVVRGLVNRSQDEWKLCRGEPW
jgi:lysozyme